MHFANCDFGIVVDVCKTKTACHGEFLARQLSMGNSTALRSFLRSTPKFSSQQSEKKHKDDDDKKNAHCYSLHGNRDGRSRTPAIESVRPKRRIVVKASSMSNWAVGKSYLFPVERLCGDPLHELRKAASLPNHPNPARTSVPKLSRDSVLRCFGSMRDQNSF